MTILHTVLLNFKSEIPEEKIHTFFNAFSLVVDTSPNACNFSYQRNIATQKTLAPYGWKMTFEFNTEEDRIAFLNSEETRKITSSGMPLIENPPQGPNQGPADLTKPCGVCVVDTNEPTSPRTMRKQIKNGEQITKEKIEETVRFFSGRTKQGVPVYENAIAFLNNTNNPPPPN